MGDPSAIKISDLPPCDPNISRIRALAASSTVVVVYEAKGEDWPGSESYAVVRFDRCGTFLGGGPNDEAIHNHPLHQCGVQPYALQEILDSPWIIERARIADKSGDPRRWVGSRHFLLAMKEGTFECIARGYALVGIFEMLPDAIKAAFDIVREN